MKEKLLFIYPHEATFISLDIKILSKKFDITTNTYNWKNKIRTPFYLIKQLIFLLKNIHKFKYIVISFGGYWSFLPSYLGYIFNKKTYIILHGTDCASMKQINYGSLRNFPLKLFCKWSYKFAYKLLPVSESLVYTENTYYEENKIIKQGYKFFFKNIKTPHYTIPNGFEIEKWNLNDKSTTRDEKSLITVVSGKSQFKRKGIDIILELAEKQLPKSTNGHGSYKYYNAFRCPHCSSPFIDFEKNRDIRPNEYYGNRLINQKLQRYENEK